MILNSVKNTYLLLFLLIIFSSSSCSSQLHTKKKEEKKVLKVGVEQTNLYLSKLKDKNIAIVANQTSVILKKNGGFEHLVDSLLSLKVKVKKVFAPEHGFRGKADAGEIIEDNKDVKTGLPIISLYGKNKKPKKEQLKGIDIVVFDIQDVGVRFYTYISTLHYVMEACAENNIPVIILDRPNPNAHYIDGPVLEMKHKSFVGMHPVPVVYGMTIGEYGKMINGEKWLNNNVNCDLTVIPLQNYTHNTPYDLPIKPSPNLPNKVSINLYPSLCFFEGTNVSVGRGTDMQFQIYGSPYLEKTSFSFKPKPNEGAKYPKHKNKICYGEDLRKTKTLFKIKLNWLLRTYVQSSKVKVKFFNSFFTKLSGTEKLQKQIINGVSEEEIRKTWVEDLDNFKKIRSKYLIYK
ncbi:MAG: DUF1343 domain-containing protein [Tenacibaculum sp.]|nr:DUF1343 domain-containing protein [Tenacibaculum sp.]